MKYETKQMLDSMKRLVVWILFVTGVLVMLTVILIIVAELILIPIRRGVSSFIGSDKTFCIPYRNEAQMLNGYENN